MLANCQGAAWTSRMCLYAFCVCVVLILVDSVIPNPDIQKRVILTNRHVCMCVLCCGVHSSNVQFKFILVIWSDKSLLLTVQRLCASLPFHILLFSLPHFSCLCVCVWICLRMKGKRIRHLLFYCFCLNGQWQCD